MHAKQGFLSCYFLVSIFDDYVPAEIKRQPTALQACSVATFCDNAGYLIAFVLKLGGAMKIPSRFFLFCFAALASLTILAGCQTTDQNANTTATTAATPPGAQQLTVVARPAKIVQMMKDRGSQDEAKPTF